MVMDNALTDAPEIDLLALFAEVEAMTPAQIAEVEAYYAALDAPYLAAEAARKVRAEAEAKAAQDAADRRRNRTWFI